MKGLKCMAQATELRAYGLVLIGPAATYPKHKNFNLNPSPRP